MTVSATRKEKFLASLAMTGRILESCKAAGISHQSLRRWREEDEAFAEAYADADLAYCEKIETEIERRGIEGWDEPVFGRGAGKEAGTEEVGVKRRYDSTLLLAMARARVQKYREKIEAEVTHKGAGVLVVPGVALNEEAFAKLVEEQKS